MKNYDVIYFDGLCNLCDGFISFIIGLNPPKNMKVTSLQGEYAAGHLEESHRLNLSSVIYQRKGKILRESTAVLWVLSDLKWYFKPLLIFLILPRFFRDGIYKGIANNRYRLFGKKDTCRLPTPEERETFL
jgi:predicted DCC family thiol-disulfide oxidoreductase YuxK